MNRLFLLLPDLAPTEDTALARILALRLPRDRFVIVVGVLSAVGDNEADELRAANVEVLSLPLRHTLDVNGVRQLRNGVSRVNPTIIHAFGPYAARVSRLLITSSEDSNTPRLVVSGASSPGSGFSGWFTSGQLRRADRIVAATRAEGERYHQAGVPSERLTRIAPAAPEPAAEHDWATFFPQLGVPPNARLIVTGSHNAQGFGPKDAITAFDMLRYEAPDLHLVVFGAGRAAKHLEQFGRALAFDDFRIHFPPDTANRAAAVRASTAVLVTNPRGGVDEVLEGMAAGKPVVAWATPDLAEIIDEGVTGLMVPLGDRAALAAKTRILIDDPAIATRMGEAARVRATQRFPTSRLIDQFARVYQELDV